MFKPTGNMRWLCTKSNLNPTVEEILKCRNETGYGLRQAKAISTIPATKILQMQVKDDNGICSWINVPEVYKV